MLSSSGDNSTFRIVNAMFIYGKMSKQIRVLQFGMECRLTGYILKKFKHQLLDSIVHTWPLVENSEMNNLSKIEKAVHSEDHSENHE